MKHGKLPMAVVLAGVFTIVLQLMLTGCSAQKQSPQVAEDAKYSKFTDQSEIVQPSEIIPSEKAKAVQADFNLDGLSDMAYVHKYESGESEVSILIQRPKPAKDEAVVYYKGGAIRRGLDGKITGVASRQANKYTDLIVLVAYTNRPDTDLICYQNDGSGFREVEETPKQGRKAAPVGK